MDKNKKKENLIKEIQRQNQKAVIISSESNQMDLNFWLTVNLARSTLISQYLPFTQYNLVQVTVFPTFK